LPADLGEIVSLATRDIVKGQETLHGSLCRLLRMKDRGPGERRYGSQFMGGGLEIHIGLGKPGHRDRRCSEGKG
jgi:hypothetical protein